MRYKIVGWLLFCLLTVPLFVNLVAANDWPMFKNDASHSGYTTDPGPITNTLLWNYTADSAVGSDVISGNYIYFGTDSGAVYCLNAQTGAKVWNFTTGAEAWPPAVSNGHVYVGSNDNHLYCLDASTGALIWSYNAGSHVYDPTVFGSYVYFGSSGHNLFCLNAQTGASVWNYTTNSYVLNVPTVSGGFVYFGTYNGMIYCLNAQTGSQVWNYSAGRIQASPCVANGYVYLCSYDDNVYCLNAQTGAKVWNYATPYVISSSPSVANGYVYFGSFDDNVYCLNAQTGAKVWNYSTGGEVESSPAVSGNGYVYIGSDDGNFYCLNAQTGSQVWNFTVSGYASSSPAIANGIAYFGGNVIFYAVGVHSTTQSTSLSIQASAPNIASGSSLTISGALIPAQSGIVTIWESINSSAFIALNNATLANGAYTYTFNPSAIGSYQFYASWPGNSQYSSSNSPLTAVSISAIQLTTPTLTLQSSSANVNPGQQATLSGSLNPSASGTVILSQSVNGSAFQQIGSTTLTNGAYSYSYTIQGTGSYVFQASFAGNSQLNPAQSSTVTVNSAQASGADYTLYIVGVVVVVLALLALYYVLVMKPKSK